MTTLKKSPFPGMDPYLELHWGDVHHSLIQYTRDALQADLPPDLLARVEERVFVERDDVRIRYIAPDTRISEFREPRGGIATAVLTEPAVAGVEPLLFPLEIDETTEGFIEIREADGSRVVTVIEFLSPTNKAGGSSTAAYVQKQQEILQSTTSLVEIDLVRAGRRVLAVAAELIPPELRQHYLVCIHRGWKVDPVELYPLSLRDPLPKLRIPLRSHEPPAELDLQAIVDQAYRNGRYDRLDYLRPLDPPLSADDAVWAASFLQPVK